jgi:hypothetical protein
MNSLIQPLLKGNSLTDPSYWKKKQLQLNLVTAIMPIAYILFPELVSIISIEFLTKLGILFSAVNVYLTAATSEKVGISY